MARNTLLAAAVSFFLLPTLVNVAIGQPKPGGQPPADPVATPPKPPAQPGGQADPNKIVFEVVEIQGNVIVGPVGLQVGKPGWTALKLRDRLGAGDVVYTSWRSKVKFAALPAKPPTVMMLESGTLLNIEEAAIVKGVAKVRLGLGYGAVRAGVAEGQVRSDMEITCPVATLSKKGTDIFRFEYANGRFNMSLSPMGRGMIQAMQFQWGGSGRLRSVRSRFVTRGQFVTHKMGQAINNVKFDRNVNINDVFGLVGNDKTFTLMNNHGFGFLLPQGGNLMAFFGPKGKGLFGLQGIQNQGQRFPRRRRQAIQHDGNFGIGQGSIPSILTGGALGAALQQRATNNRGTHHGPNSTRGRRK